MKYPNDKLGSHIDILSGFAFKSSDFIDSGIPVIKIKNITPPSVTLEDLSYVSEEIAEQQSKYLLKHNDVLIALTGSHINQMASVVGRIARVRYDIPSLLNQRVGKITVFNPEEANIDYIYYFLSQNSIKILLASKAGGAANQANISPTDIKNLMIPFPDIQIQRKIASVLSAYDDLIENNQKQIKLLEEAAQRLYKEWFIDLRFPGHENTPIHDGLPEGWELGTLGQLATFKRGQMITKDLVQHGTVPVVAGGLEPAYYHNIANTKAPVITVSGSGANAGYTKMYHVDVFASDCSFADINSTSSLEYAYCFLIEKKNDLRHMQKGSAQPHVYAKDINALPILIPEVCLLKKFCDIVAKMLDKIGILEKQNILLMQARDCLIPKLMSVEIDV